MTSSADTPSRIVVVADDLTSATDCGVQMMTLGLRTFIPMRPGCRIPPTTDVISIDTDSRDETAGVAYDLTRAAVEPFKNDPRVAFYKSIDSTLRGNLGAELDAILDSGSFDVAVIAPAFPTYGRTTIDGCQYLDGRPIHETEFGSDPTSPVASAAIAGRFAEQSRRKAAVVPLDMQMRGVDAVLETIAEKRAAGVDLFVFDARDEGDLDRLCHMAASFPGRVLWVGSTGLSRYVPRALGLTPHEIRRRLPIARGCALIVAGSASETTRAQLDACSSMEGFVEIQVAAEAISIGDRSEQQELARAHGLLRDAVGRANAVALTLTASRRDIARTRELAAMRGLPAHDIGIYLAGTLGRLTAELINDGAAVRGLILTGGTTAKTVVFQLQAEAIELLEQIEPGIPLGHLRGRRDLLVVTKAGGFGGRNAIRSAVERIAHYDEA